MTIHCSTTKLENMSTINLQTTLERAIVIRVDRYELPHLALVTEAEVHPDEEAEIVEVEVDCQCYVVYCPAQTDGLPENCHPDESEFEIQEVTPCEPEFADMPLGMTEEEYHDVEHQARNYSQDDFDPPEPDFYDAAEECWV